MVRSIEGQGERGAALVTALLTLLLVSVALAIAGGSLLMDLHALRHEARAVEVSALTDAAVADALAHLSADDSFAGFTAYGFGEGELESAVSFEGGLRYRVRAGASLRGSGRCVEVEVSRQQERLTVLRWSRLYEGSAAEASACIAAINSL
ncbi:MAG: hypothetical protein AAGD01_03885 [Acidobacteriota bacterium]